VSDHTLARYAEILRDDFVGFAHRAFLELYPGREFESNWHIDVLAERLENIRSGRSKRLIINLPPRSLKSFLGSVAFPAYLLGHNPSAEILCTSYGQDFANDLALPCRTLMLSPFYQALFSTRLSDERQAVEEFKTTAGGARRAVSWTGAVMGRGADFIIIDDPIKADDALSETRRAAVNESFHTSISTRLNRDTGAIILIMQRLHANDLTAFVQKDEHWDVIALPAIAKHNEIYAIHTPYGRRTISRREGQVLQPQRQSLQTLIERRNAQGSRTFDAQYQQNPHGAENAIIQRDWLAYYDDNTKPSEFDTTLQSWDTATKPGENNSYSVCTTWGIRENRFYLLDVVRERLGFRDLKLKAISLAREHKPTTILVEEQSSGSPLLSELEAKGFPVQAIPSGSASKAERLYARSNMFESGRVLLPRKATWLDAYVDELTTFPDSDFSDQVDSTSQALTWDTSNTNFNNAIRALELLNGGQPFGEKSQKTIKLRILEGGGTINFADGSGRPDIQIPQTGEILEIDEQTGARLVHGNWKKYEIIPE
jgi:predicted phage terminase large subunit-like protein